MRSLVVVQRKKPLVGACLRQELPHVSSDHLAKVLGTHDVLSCRADEKYSRSIYVRLSDDGNVCDLYRCYGEWRIGALPETPNSVIEQIVALVEPPSV